MSNKKKNLPLPELPSGVTGVDTHCHLDMSAYSDDLDEVIRRAENSGVARIITIGIDAESSKRAVEIAGKYPGVFAAIGIHPHNSNGATDEDFEFIAKLADNPRVVAYGEIGLDFAKQFSPLPLQDKIFGRQVRFAGELGLPVIIHDRDAHEECYGVLRKHAPFDTGGVMHCFSGDAQFAARIIDLGLMISIPGIVTYNKAETMVDAVKSIPLDSLLLETDGPYLSPVPKRGKRNEPANILYTAQKIAEIKDISLEEVVKRTTENAVKLFGIGG